MSCAARLKKLAPLHIPSASPLALERTYHDVVHEMNDSVCPYDRDETAPLDFRKFTISAL
jgi:hypothetical protein